MKSDSSVQSLVQILESLILDLDEKKRYLEEEKEDLEKVSRLLAYTKDNIETVGIYADQELITSNLEKIGCSKEEYKACCYLLKSEDANVKNLPQYENSYNLISDIIEFFKLHKADLMVDIQELKEVCKKKELEKKYYDILSKPNPFIEDVDEFTSILNGYDLTSENKINILVSIINSNLLNYGIKNNEG